VPDPILREVALPVAFPLEPTLQKLVADMHDTMSAEGGVGLAAPQVGTSLRIIVTEAWALVNPVIIGRSEVTEQANEGCLSIPGLNVIVRRPRRVTVQAYDLADQREVIIQAKGDLARVLQHEIDHLDGKLITDYLRRITW
jgi:peptide deformylase